MGTLLMKRAGIRRDASHVETDKPGRSLTNDPTLLCPMRFAAVQKLRGAVPTTAVWDEQSLTARQAEMASRMRRPFFFFFSLPPPAFSQGHSGSSLVKIRKVGDGK